MTCDDLTKFSFVASGGVFTVQQFFDKDSEFPLERS
jgi:hypothetical protein